MEYTSRSQMARVLSESWITGNGYCLACDSDRLMPTTANTEVRDFECSTCRHPYELKSAMRPFGRRVVDGAFASMMRRVETNSLPTFLLLQYSGEGRVSGLSAIHRSLITPELIEKRKPLSSTARRAGWIGCNLLLSAIPPEGRISLVENGIILPKELCRSVFRATAKLEVKSIGTRGWTRALLVCLHRLPQDSFTLNDAYRFESDLSAIYPNNRNVRAKMRQQLQVLRDAGLLIFESAGKYRLAYTSQQREV